MNCSKLALGEIRVSTLSQDLQLGFLGSDILIIPFLVDLKCFVENVLIFHIVIAIAIVLIAYFVTVNSYVSIIFIVTIAGRVLIYITATISHYVSILFLKLVHFPYVSQYCRLELI